MGEQWVQFRSACEEVGIDFNLYSNTTLGFNLQGGLDTTNANRLSTSYDLLLHLDFEKMKLIEGGELLVFAQGFYGRNVNDKVAAIGDPFDDADGDKSIYIDQLWYQHSLFDKKLQFRIGYLDQQSILDRNAYANSEDKQFMNALLDNNNAIIPLTIGQGAAVFWQPTDWLGFVFAVADGDGRQFRDGFDTAWHGSADFFVYFQTDLRITLPSDNGPLPGTYRFGTLYDPRTKLIHGSEIESRREDFNSDDYGLYCSVDQMVYRESPDDDQGLGIFARYGYRHTNVNQISQFWSTGLQYKGLVPYRGLDVLGAGVYSVHASNDYQRYVDADFSRETGFELYYKIQVTPWLTITPDLQYIAQPGGSRDARDAIVAGLRARFSL